MKQDAHCPGCNKGMGILKFKKPTFGWKCSKCGILIVSEEDPGTCSKCKEATLVSTGEFTGSRVSEKLCQTCQNEVDQFDRILGDGGIRWRCKDCNNEGVFEAPHPYAQMFRDEGIDPKTSGLLLDRDDCPFCRKVFPLGIALPEQLFRLKK
jgi:hypothetical protein